MQPSVGIKKYVCLGVEGEGVGAVWGRQGRKETSFNIYPHATPASTPKKQRRVI